MNKITILFGNGFNYQIKNILEFADCKDSAEKIYDITKLWMKFDKIFKDIKKDINIENDEIAMQIIYSVIKFLSNLEKINSSFIQEIYNTLHSKITQNIIEIAQEFFDHEHSKEYSLLHSCFSLSEAPFGKHLQDYLNTQNIILNTYTTNYDGILDTLFAYNGIFYKDGFGYKDSECLQYKDEISPSDNTCFHIHGSYKFKESFDMTVKLKKEVQNSNPVMIFNKPNSKLKIIKKDPVLYSYFKKFETSLKDNKHFIIFGNSLECEPHILTLMDKTLTPDHRITIISDNPEKVLEFLKKKVYLEKNIFLECTAGIKTPQNLLDFFKKVFFQTIGENI